MGHSEDAKGRALALIYMSRASVRFIVRLGVGLELR